MLYTIPNKSFIFRDQEENMSVFNVTNFFDQCQSQINSSAYYQKLQALPKQQRWLVLTALFLVSQIIVFGSLYLFFGEIAAIGLLRGKE